jgi:hypothetical protein
MSPSTPGDVDANHPKDRSTRRQKPLVLVVGQRIRRRCDPVGFDLGHQVGLDPGIFLGPPILAAGTAYGAVERVEVRRRRSGCRCEGCGVTDQVVGCVLVGQDGASDRMVASISDGPGLPAEACICALGCQLATPERHPCSRNRPVATAHRSSSSSRSAIDVDLLDQATLE